MTAYTGRPGDKQPTALGSRKLADAKRDMALHALVAARRTGLASEQAAAMVACAEWCTAELLAGRVTA